MPDLRLAKTRQTLPTGYQFGDAAGPGRLHQVGEPDGLRSVTGSEYHALGLQNIVQLYVTSRTADHTPRFDEAQGWITE